MAMAMGLAASLAGCGAPDEAPSIGAAAAALTAANGLSPNGLARNGLARNGLARNGLARNGLARNGLLTADFQGWFDEDPATADAVMTYLARCAVPAGQALSYTSPTSGATFTWSGSLGLAPGWSSGLEATVAEEQVITACLAAHTNYYGRQIDIAVEGVGADGAAIPQAPGELSTYSVREAAFFGNLFDGSGALYSCRDHKEWSTEYSSARACAFDYKHGAAPTELCAPIVFLGTCWDYCSWNELDAFTGCTYGGQAYLPITTRILPADVFRCGDGVCQLTERCGTGNSYDSCKDDCGPCPEAGGGATSTVASIPTDGTALASPEATVPTSTPTTTTTDGTTTTVASTTVTTTTVTTTKTTGKLRNGSK
jgi:hypothetical protein